MYRDPSIACGAALKGNVVGECWRAKNEGIVFANARCIGIGTRLMQMFWVLPFRMTRPIVLGLIGDTLLQ